MPASTDRADCLLHLLHWWIQPKAVTPWAFFWAFEGGPIGAVGEAAAYDALPQLSAGRDPNRHGPFRAQEHAEASAGARGLPPENSHCAGLRRRHRVAARSGTSALNATRQPDLLQARGHPGGVQLQAARRVQQDGA